MLEADHRLAPINPGDDSRTYVIAAADRQDSTRVLARLLEGMHFGEWPDHIAKFEAESL